MPIYNAEKFLRASLHRVCNQDLMHSDYEIILINDGSKDASAKIIAEFQKDYSNIILVNQKNKGVSAARNAGLDIATGDYITFVDADDEIFPDSLQQQIDYATANNLDLLYPKITYIDAEGNITGEFIMDSDKEEILDGFHHQRRGYIVAFYRRALIQNIRFNINLPIAEDSLFNIEVHAIAKRCSYNNLDYYRYRKGIVSSSQNTIPKTEKAFLGLIEFLHCINKIVKKNKNNFSEQQIRYYDRPYFVTILMMLQVNIIPTISISRFQILKREMKKLKIEYIADAVQETLPFFKSHWLFFFVYHLPKVIQYRIKIYIYKKLIQFKMIKH